HCVTEMVTGIDIVREQIRVACGDELPFAQEDIQLRGHAIECRINAETAATNFAPAPGRITHYVEPGGPGVRVDSGAREGYEVLPLYDPMIAKLIVWDTDRDASTRRMIRALSEYEIGGLTTLIGFHTALMDTDQWRAGETCRDLVEDKDWLKALATDPSPAQDESEEPEKVERDYAVEVSGRRFDVKVIGEAMSGNGGNGSVSAARKPPKRSERKSGGEGGPDLLEAPLQGNMWKVVVGQGDEVEEGQLLCIIEAMKMENEINAHKAGTISDLPIAEGEPIKTGDPIATITSAPAEE
ncbi:MAG: carbamoyl phosphate synthase, partial [Thermoleophilaceae bacterium]|nr:carbamoyl phosphate synthase [Thermoleophilaceae bacterium]